MSELESPEKIAKDIAKLERNLNQVAHIFGCIEYSHGLLDALRMIHGII